MPRSFELSIPFRLSTKDFICMSHIPMCTVCLANLNFLDLIILIQYFIKFSPTLCQFFPLGSNMVLTTILSNIFKLFLPCDRQSFTPVTGKIYIFIF
jgi:hypothetical protein